MGIVKKESIYRGGNRKKVMGVKKQSNSKDNDIDEVKVVNWFDFETMKDICCTVWTNYCSETPKRLKLIDAYLVYVAITGAIQFFYAIIVGAFPFNSILAGFISCVGSFVLGVSLRLQNNEKNQSEFGGISKEQAFADFIFAHIILHLV